MMIAKRFPLPILCFIAISSSLYGAVQQQLEPRLPPEYQKWINEGVRWIISSPEKEEFLKLATDEQRDRFVLEFWEHHNPNPGSKENQFKEEHYRRIAFSNEHFAANMPGWKTDRGHVYIIYGPPDSIIKHSFVGATPAEELWKYRHLPAVGGDVSLQFVDRCACGEYALVGNLPNSN
jgi:GWxTD domain-containing protein